MTFTSKPAKQQPNISLDPQICLYHEGFRGPPYRHTVRTPPPHPSYSLLFFLRMQKAVYFPTFLRFFVEIALINMKSCQVCWHASWWQQGREAKKEIEKLDSGGHIAEAPPSSVSTHPLSPSGRHFKTISCGSLSKQGRDPKHALLSKRAGSGICRIQNEWVSTRREIGARIADQLERKRRGSLVSES